MAMVRDTRGRSGSMEDMPMVAVKVGDWVGFKADIEQSGEIIEIIPGSRRYMSHDQLRLRNKSGFGGDYLRHATETVMAAGDCWVE